MAVHVLWLPQFTPTPLNQLLGNPSKAARLKKGDRDLVSYEVGRQALPLAQTPRQVSLRVVLQKGQRACDPDAVWKSLLDALVCAGALVNDSPRWCRPLGVEFVRSERVRETFVILEDVE